MLKDPNFWMAIGVLATLLVGYAAYQVGRTANRQASDQFRNQLMPILRVNTPRLARPLRVGETVQVNVQVRNTPGRDVARQVLIGGKVQIGDMGFFPDGEYHAIDGPRVDLVDSDVLETPVFSDRPVTASDLAKLRDGLSELFVHGEIRYSTSLTASPGPVRFFYAYEINSDAFHLGDNRGFINREKSVFR